jgi:hypothetical protein
MLSSHKSESRFGCLTVVRSYTVNAGKRRFCALIRCGKIRSSVATQYLNRGRVEHFVGVAVRMGSGFVAILLVVIVATAKAELVVAIDIGPVTVLAGRSASGLQDGLLSNATFNIPHQMLVSPFDDSVVFVADMGNGVVRRIDLMQSTVATWVGSGSQSDAPGTGTSAGLAVPECLLTDPNNDRYLFVGCSAGIRRVEIETARVETFTGVGVGYAEGTASTAKFRQVQMMVVQSNTLDLLVTDLTNHRVRRVNSGNGFTSLVAGGATSGGNDGVAESATFNFPVGIVFYRDSSSMVLVSDYYNFCLRRINVTSRAVVTVSPCFAAGMEDGPLSSARFRKAHALTRPSWSGFAYLADPENHRIRRIDLDAGVVASVVGSGTAGWQASQSSVTALIGSPIGVAFGCRGGFLTMYVSGYHAIATVDMSKTADIGTCRPTAVNIGPVTLLAGQGTVSGAADGTALNASFTIPQGIVPTPDGQALIVLDEQNNVLRRLNLTTNVVDTWVGQTGQPGLVPLAGTNARLPFLRHAIIHPRKPSQLMVLTSVALLVVDFYTAAVSILSGQSATGYVEGLATVARFDFPAGVIGHPNTIDVIVADTNNYRLRRVSLDDGSTALMVGSAPRSVDGPASSAYVHGPVGLAILPRVGPPNRLYVGDHWGSCIRGVSLGDHSVTSLTSCGDNGAKRDGALRTARFTNPSGFTVVPPSWSAGAFLVAEHDGHRIRMVDIAAGGWVTTVVGTGSAGWRPSTVSSLEAQLSIPVHTTFHLRPSGDLHLYIGFKSSIARVNARLTLGRHETVTMTQALSHTASTQVTARRTGRAPHSSRTLSRMSARTAARRIATSTVISSTPTFAPTRSVAVTSQVIRDIATSPTRREPLRLTLSGTRTASSEPHYTAPKTVGVGHSAVVPVTARVAATAVAAVGAAVVGLVGVPVAARPAVAGAAIRMATCVGDGANGPKVPPYEAMPARFAVLGTPAATAGSAVTSNAAVVILCIVGAYATVGNPRTTTLSDRSDDSRNEPKEVTGSGNHHSEPVTIRASMAHAAATVPFSYISPALVEFSVMWLSAAAAPGSTFAIGSWVVGFVVGLAVAFASWGLLAWRGHAVAVAVHDANGTGGSDGRWVTLVGPLIAATRDVASPRVRYAFFVEVGCGLLFSALSGIRVESLCVAKCIAATLVALAFLGYLLVVQPAAERMDHWFGVGFAALQALTGALLAAAVLDGRGRGGLDAGSSSTWSSTAVNVAESMSLATLVLLVVQAVVGLIFAVRNASSHRTYVSAHTDRPTLDRGLLSVPVCEVHVAHMAAGGVQGRPFLSEGPGAASQELDGASVSRRTNPLFRPSASDSV